MHIKNDAAFSVTLCVLIKGFLSMAISQFPVQFPIFYEDDNLKSIFQTFTLNEGLLTAYIDLKSL